MEPFEYTVTRQDDGWFAASTPYRAIVWLGETEHAAIGNAMRGLAELARDGAMNPDDPHAPGRGPDVVGGPQ